MFKRKKDLTTENVQFLNLEKLVRIVVVEQTNEYHGTEGKEFQCKL